MFLLLYVNDILVTGAFEVDINDVIQTLHQQFSLKDLGDLHYFLELEVTRGANNMHVSQQKYARELLE